MKGELRMNNTTNNTTVTTMRKELTRISDTASDLVENLEVVRLMLSDVLNTLDLMSTFFDVQAHRYMGIAIDYAHKALQDAETIYKQIERMRNGEPVEPVKGE